MAQDFRPMARTGNAPDPLPGPAGPGGVVDFPPPLPVAPGLRFWAVSTQLLGAFLLARAADGLIQSLLPPPAGYSPWAVGTSWPFWLTFLTAILLKDALPGLWHLRRLFGHRLFLSGTPFAEETDGGALPPFVSLRRHLPWLVPFGWLYGWHPYRLWFDPTFGPPSTGALQANPGWMATGQAMVLLAAVGVLNQFSLGSSGKSLGDHLAGTEAAATGGGRPAEAPTVGARTLVVLALVGFCLQVDLPPLLDRAWSEPARLAIEGTPRIDGEIWWQAGLANWAAWQRYRALPPTPARLAWILKREGGGTPLGSVVEWTTIPDGLPASEAWALAQDKAPGLRLGTGPTGWFGRLACRIPGILFGIVDEVHFDDRGAVLSRKVFE